jgi:hypothetical protein
MNPQGIEWDEVHAHEAGRAFLLVYPDLKKINLDLNRGLDSVLARRSGMPPTTTRVITSWSSARRSESFFTHSPNRQKGRQTAVPPSRRRPRHLC